MDAEESDGTVKLQPIVTMLTEALARDFAPVYEYVSDEQLWKDVESWLLGLEDDMTNNSDKTFASMTVHMVRKNRGWVHILAARVRKLLVP